MRVLALLPVQKAKTGVFPQPALLCMLTPWGCCDGAEGLQRPGNRMNR